jgi:hypothetical protein
MTVTNGDVLKAFCEFVLSDGTIAQNVFHFVANFTDDQSDSAVVAAIEGYIEDFYNALSTYLSNSFTINPGYVHKIGWSAVAGKWVVDAFLGGFTPTIAHSSTDDNFPNQIAPVIVGNTYRPKSRGRKFIMGFVDTSADGGDLISGALTALGNALNHYLADETVSGVNLLSPGVPRESEDWFLNFSDGVVSSIVGTQRRRKPGVGG